VESFEFMSDLEVIFGNCLHLAV